MQSISQSKRAFSSMLFLTMSFFSSVSHSEVSEFDIDEKISVEQYIKLSDSDMRELRQLTAKAKILEQKVKVKELKKKLESVGNDSMFSVPSGNFPESSNPMQMQNSLPMPPDVSIGSGDKINNLKTSASEGEAVNYSNTTAKIAKPLPTELNNIRVAEVFGKQAVIELDGQFYTVKKGSKLPSDWRIYSISSSSITLAKGKGKKIRKEKVMFYLSDISADASSNENKNPYSF